jgi:type I restriction enzyme M protein
MSAQLMEVLDDDAGKETVAKLVKQWAGLNKLEARHQQYKSKNGDQKSVNARNKAQHQLREAFDPFFALLHECLKQLDKANDKKIAFD